MKTMIEKYKLLKKEFEIYDMKLVAMDKHTYDMFIKFYELSSIDHIKLLEQHKELDEQIFLLWEKQKLKKKLNMYKANKQHHDE